MLRGDTERMLDPLADRTGLEHPSKEDMEALEETYFRHLRPCGLNHDFTTFGLHLRNQILESRMVEAAGGVSPVLLVVGWRCCACRL